MKKTNQKTNDESLLKPKGSLRSIKEANLAVRILAVVMDAVLMFFIWAGLASYVFTPIANKAFKYSEIGAKQLQLEVSSNLCVCTETNNDQEKVININNGETIGNGIVSYIQLSSYESDDINFYKERLHYYYCCFKTGENVVYPEGKNFDDFVAPNYNKVIKNNNGDEILPKDYYTDVWFNSKFSDFSSVEKAKEYCLEAENDFYYQDYFQELVNKNKKIQIFIFLPPYIISFSLFFILIPTLCKNGETLGKKVMHLGFISKDFYDVKKRQIIIRQVILLLYVSLSLFVLGIGITSLATLGVGVFIYFLATFISKTKRSPVDYFAYVYLIDTRTSVWFSTPEVELKKEKELEENMSKYRKTEVENKNVIQIGSTIVDETVKEEFEKEKLNKSKSKNL